MSYILDALRKADAQRERDPARGIHAQPLPAVQAEAGWGTTQRAWWALAILAVAALLATGWYLGQTAPVAGAKPSAQATAPLPAPARPAAVAPSVPPAAVVQPLPPPAAPVVVAAPAAPAATAAPATPAAPVVTTPAAAVAVAASAPAPAGGNGGAVPLAQLPADVQRELPKLAISGGVHSANAAQRMLIVNGQVIGEGAEPAPGLVLEEIRAGTAVWRFRGHRFTQGY